jgi:hypothetical protein
MLSVNSSRQAAQIFMFALFYGSKGLQLGAIEPDEAPEEEKVPDAEPLPENNPGGDGVPEDAPLEEFLNDTFEEDGRDEDGDFDDFEEDLLDDDV